MDSHYTSYLVFFFRLRERKKEVEKYWPHPQILKSDEINNSDDHKNKHTQDSNNNNNDNSNNKKKENGGLDWVHDAETPLEVENLIEMMHWNATFGRNWFIELVWSRGVAHVVLGFVPAREIFPIADQRVDGADGGSPTPHSDLHLGQHNRSYRPVSFLIINLKSLALESHLWATSILLLSLLLLLLLLLLFSCCCCCLCWFGMFCRCDDGWWWSMMVEDDWGWLRMDGGCVIDGDVGMAFS